MALNYDGRRLRILIALATALALVPSIAWCQQAEQPTDSWRKRLAGDWCDAEHGCTHWWTLYEVRVGAEDRITIRYRDTRLVVFDGSIQEPLGKWMIKGKIKTKKLDKDGKELEEDFNAAVSELGGVKEVIEGKVKGTLTARIQSADIEGIRVQEVKGITISKALIDSPRIGGPKIDDPKIKADDSKNKGEDPNSKADDPKKKGEDAKIKISAPRIDDVTIEKVEIKEPVTDGGTIKGAKEIKGEKLHAKKMEAKGIEADKLEAEKIIGEKIEGGRQVEISVPLQISEATIEGSTKVKARREKTSDEKEAGGDEEDGEGKRRLEIKGTIKGKIGSGEWKGDFTGTFTALVQAGIKGTYTVLPATCSEAGRLLSEEEETDRRRRAGASDQDKVRLPGRFRSEKKKEPAVRRPEATGRTFVETEGEREARSELPRLGEKTTRIEVEAGEWAAPRPAETHKRGKFMRRVNGTVNVIEPSTISLELPALPVLDKKCSVVSELPKRTLKLVKQHDAVR